MLKEKILGLVVVTILSAGCSAAVKSGTYTVASTKHSADVLGSEFVLVKQNATGSASKPIILVPFGFPRDYKIMESILEEYDGDVLTNLKITSKTSIFLLFGAVKLNITCDVWRIANQAELRGEAHERTYTIGEIGEVAFRRDAATHMMNGGERNESER